MGKWPATEHGPNRLCCWYFSRSCTSSAEITWRGLACWSESPTTSASFQRVSTEDPSFPISLLYFKHPNRGRANGTNPFYRPLFFSKTPFHSTRKIFKIFNRFLFEWKMPLVSVFTHTFCQSYRQLVQCSHRRRHCADLDVHCDRVPPLRFTELLLQLRRHADAAWISAEDWPEVQEEDRADRQVRRHGSARWPCTQMTRCSSFDPALAICGLSWDESLDKTSWIILSSCFQDKLGLGIFCNYCYSPIQCCRELFPRTRLNWTVAVLVTASKKLASRTYLVTFIPGNQTKPKRTSLKSRVPTAITRSHKQNWTALSARTPCPTASWRWDLPLRQMSLAVSVLTERVEPRKPGMSTTERPRVCDWVELGIGGRGWEVTGETISPSPILLFRSSQSPQLARTKMADETIGWVYPLPTKNACSACWQMPWPCTYSPEALAAGNLR